MRLLNTRFSLLVLRLQSTKLPFMVRLLMLCVLLVPGISKATGVGSFIVGGQAVNSAAKYPFMASIQLDPFNFGEYSHSCGGTLISQFWVLTAAHCMRNSFGRTYNPDNVGIILGKPDLAGGGGTFVNAEEIILHPQYDPNTVRNDIALIRLASPYASPLAVLPAEGSPVPVIGESSIVAGWGALVEGGRASNLLREVALPVISNAACFPFYPSNFDSRLALCAGGSRSGGQDSCSGDSGGPLLVVRDNVYVVAGIISFGAGCARRGVPGVYTRVEAYTAWITAIASGTLEFGEQLRGQPVDDTVITQLDVNTARSGSILAGEVAYYNVSGARQVNLVSNTGDADLFVIDDADFQAISSELLRCVSENATPLDVCVINQQDSAYAVVFGYTDTDYTISTQRVISDSNTVNSFTGSGTEASGFFGSGALSIWLLMLLPAIRWCRRSQQ